LPTLESAAVRYMMSKEGYLSDHDGHWHPHLMFSVPQTDTVTWGANLPGSPILASNDTPDRLTVFLIPVAQFPHRELRGLLPILTKPGRGPAFRTKARSSSSTRRSSKASSTWRSISPVACTTCTSIRRSRNSRHERLGVSPMRSRIPAVSILPLLVYRMFEQFAGAGASIRRFDLVRS
jgi:hypothetical protein